MAEAAELPPGGSFVDDDGSVHEGYIEALASQDITRGCGDHVYCPTDEVTRGQMAAFLRRALELPASDVDHFADDDGSLFEGDIDALATAGITVGCNEDGSAYCPDRPITREQMAAFLARAANLPAGEPDRFRDDDASPFEAEIDAIAAAGITAGCNPPDNTRFCPDATTTRQQMASFLARLLELDPIDPPARRDADTPVLASIEAWFGDQYQKAVRVADCESGLNPRAVNPRGFHGLFQVASAYHRDAFARVTGVSWDEGVYVPYYNAQYARYLHDQSGGWGPWPHCGRL